jgi:hypothetical protein
MAASGWPHSIRGMVLQYYWAEANYKSSANIISDMPLPPGTIGNTFSF